MHGTSCEVVPSFRAHVFQFELGEFPANLSLKKKCISKTLRGEQTTPSSSVALQLFLKGHYLRVAAKNRCTLVTIGTRTHYFERVAQSIARLTSLH